MADGDARLTSERQSTNANVSYTTAQHRQSLRLELAIDITPTIARSQLDCRLISRNLDLIQVDEVDGQAILEIRGTGKTSVTTALDCKRAIKELRDKYSGCDLWQIVGGETRQRGWMLAC